MNPKKTVTLLLVRHGQAQSNVSMTLTSYPEVKPMPLSEQGRREVKKTAQSLVDTSITTIFASPLTRTQETASIMNEVLGVPVITETRLRETDFGIYNNTSYTQFFLRYPHPSMRKHMSLETKAEGLLNVRERAKDFLKSLQQDYPGKTVALVTHADVIREIIMLLNHKERTWSSVATGSMQKVILKEDTALD